MNLNKSNEKYDMQIKFFNRFFKIRKKHFRLFLILKELVKFSTVIKNLDSFAESLLSSLIFRWCPFKKNPDYDTGYLYTISQMNYDFQISTTCFFKMRGWGRCHIKPDPSVSALWQKSFLSSWSLQGNDDLSGNSFCGSIVRCSGWQCPYRMFCRFDPSESGNRPWSRSSGI